MDDGLIDKPPVMGSSVGKAKGFLCNMQLKTLGIKVSLGSQLQLQGPPQEHIRTGD